jgi:DNA-nicking Smr family endonuclease
VVARVSTRLPRRPLSAAERALWQEVACSVRPLHPRRGATLPKPEPVEPNAKAPSRAMHALLPSAVVATKEVNQRSITLDPQEHRKLIRGRVAIDRRLDLHGMTQAEAHQALARFLRASRDEGARFLLVITGKGSRGADGVLRRQVPLWLSSPGWRDMIVGFDTAAINHGGEGALYVRLRKKR